RKKVFIEEQQVPPEEEWDQYEESAYHFVLYDHHNHPSGAGRLRIINGKGKVERICILKEQRGNGLGQLLMNAIEKFAKKLGINSYVLNAQSQAIPFYKKLGYQISSDEFIEAGIKHRTMMKDL